MCDSDGEDQECGGVVIKFRPMWEKCDCDDFWCHLHGEHAFECPCPPVDEWLEQHDTTPYDIEVPVIYDADDPFLEEEEDGDYPE